MSSSGDPISVQQAYTPSGTAQWFGMKESGVDISMMNPATMNPANINPSAYQYTQNNAQISNMLQNSAAAGAFNPNFYEPMKQAQEAQITSSLGNQYARMGLAGSSAEMGGLNQAIQQNQMNWLNRQQSDQLRAAQALSGLNQQGYQQTMGIQNQYQNFQNVMAQSQLNALGMKYGQEAANQQMLGSMFGSVPGMVATAGTLGVFGGGPMAAGYGMSTMDDGGFGSMPYSYA